MATEPRHRVVIVGGGFGGLFAAKFLRRVPVEVTLIDRANHHTFQPLLYQLATGILSEGAVAPPLRQVLRRHRNARVELAEVTGFDLQARTVTAAKALGPPLVVPYDSLIVAAGATGSYFGHDEFTVFAPGMKTVDDALELRARIFGAFEMAELEQDPEAQRLWLTFAVIGAGPTGVELRMRTRVNDVKADAIVVQGQDGEEHIPCHTRVWAAGVQGSPLGAMVAQAAGAKTDRAGRVEVLPDCTLPDHPEVFVVGDLMALNKLPGVAEVAMQSGLHAARTIKRRQRGDAAAKPFRYRDLGSMATISRFRAIVSFRGIRVGGFIGWIMWAFVHLTFLTGFKNRCIALFKWLSSFVGASRDERTITAHQVSARVIAMHAGVQPSEAGFARFMGEHSGAEHSGAERSGSKP